MSTNKIRGGAEHAQMLAAAAGKPTPDQYALTPAQVGRFKDALFEHGGMSVPMRRGATARMPLRSPKGNPRLPQRIGARHAAQEGIDAGPAEDGLRLEGKQENELRINFHDADDGKDGRQDQRDQQHRDEARFARLFQLAPFRVDVVEGDEQAGMATREDSSARRSLPPMRSLPEVIQHIHLSMQSDPSGKFLPVLLRKINAAVLRGEIKLPVITRVAEARGLLIEIFGKGHRGSGALADPSRSVNAMLPLWFVNLSKRRTETQRVHAAARLSLPRISVGRD